MNRRKAYTFYLILLHVHRSLPKKNETPKKCFGPLLKRNDQCLEKRQDKGKGIWAFRALSCGTGIKPRVGDSWKMWIMLVGLFIQIYLGVSSPGGQNVLFLVQEGLLSHGKFYNLFFGWKEEVRGPLAHLLFLWCLQLKIIKMLKWTVLGQCALNPFSSYLSVWVFYPCNAGQVTESLWASVFSPVKSG